VNLDIRRRIFGGSSTICRSAAAHTPSRSLPPAARRLRSVSVVLRRHLRNTANSRPFRKALHSPCPKQAIPTPQHQQPGSAVTRVTILLMESHSRFFRLVDEIVGDLVDAIYDFDANQGLEPVERLKPDWVVVDLEAPATDGFALVRRLASEYS